MFRFRAPAWLLRYEACTGRPVTREAFKFFIHTNVATERLRVRSVRVIADWFLF